MPSAASLSSRPRDRLALFALLGGASLIAFAPIFVRLSQIGPISTAFYRLALALPVLWLWAGWDRARQAPAPAAPGRWWLILPGLFFAGDLALWHLSIRYTSVADSTLLANFAPIFVVLAEWLLWKRRFRRLFLGGLALGLVGAVLLLGHSMTLAGRHLQGDLLGLGTAMFYGGYILSVARLRGRHSTARVMAWSGTAACLVLFPLAWFSGESLAPLSWEGWVVLLALAWLSHVGGQGLIAFALAHLPPSFGAISLLWQPVGATLLAWAILGEGLSPLQALGGGLVLAGIALARLAPLARS